MRDLADNYRNDGDTVLIELALRQPMQLFNTLDPSPFHERDMDADAEDYIVGAVREIAIHKPLKLILHLPVASLGGETAQTIGEAIRNYFTYRAFAQQRELRLVFRRGRTSLAIGCVFLAACVTAQQLTPLLVRAPLTAATLREWFVIGGWVAMWRPLQIFLYDWWPIAHLIKVYRKLSAIRVEISPAVEPAQGAGGGQPGGNQPCR